MFIIVFVVLNCKRICKYLYVIELWKWRRRHSNSSYLPYDRVLMPRQKNGKEALQTAVKGGKGWTTVWAKSCIFPQSVSTSHVPKYFFRHAWWPTCSKCHFPWEMTLTEGRTVDLGQDPLSFLPSICETQPELDDCNIVFLISAKITRFSAAESISTSLSLGLFMFWYWCAKPIYWFVFEPMR